MWERMSGRWKNSSRVCVVVCGSACARVWCKKMQKRGVCVRVVFPCVWGGKRAEREADFRRGVSPKIKPGEKV